MKLQFKNKMKHFMCLSLAAGILASNSASALAAEPAKSVKTDYDLLADMVSERYYLDEELAKNRNVT